MGNPPTGQVVAQARELGSSARAYELCFARHQDHDARRRAAGSAAAAAPEADVVLLQNGLPEGRAERLLGPGRVIGCVVGWGPRC